VLKPESRRRQLHRPKELTGVALALGGLAFTGPRASSEP
jgi:hypothetical protein